MASVKIPMNSVDKVFVPDPTKGDLVIEFKKVDDGAIPYTIYIDDPQWTLIISDEYLIIEK